MSKALILKEFQTIPSVGPRVAEDLWNLGYRSIAELKGENPETMYQKLCTQAGMHVDRCMLYTFRCIVYFASAKKHDPKLLKWWNWKDD
jgi:hypothetical protein